MEGPVGGPSGFVATASALHQPHHVKDPNHVGDQYIEVQNFTGPVLGDNNAILLPSNDMVIQDLWIEFQMPVAAGAADAAYICTDNWVGSAGVQLQLNEKTLIAVSEQEMMLWNPLVCQNATQLLRRLIATNNLSQANRRTANGAANLYYMNLRRVADLWQYCGPVGSYPSKKWGLDVHLKAANKIVDGSDTAAGTVSAITSMKLIMIGHRESQDNMNRIADRLLKGGLLIALVEANLINQTWAAAATSATLSAPALEGEISSIALMIRETAGITGATGTTCNPRDFNAYNLNTDTLSIGVSANPTKMYGKPIAMKTLRMVAPNTSYPGGGMFYDAEGTVTDMKMILLPFGPAEGAAMRFGVDSGTRFVKNDLQLNFAFSSTVTADTATMLAYAQRGLRLNANGFEAWNMILGPNEAGTSLEE